MCGETRQPAAAATGAALRERSARRRGKQSDYEANNYDYDTGGDESESSSLDDDMSMSGAGSDESVAGDIAVDGFGNGDANGAPPVVPPRELTISEKLEAVKNREAELLKEFEHSHIQCAKVCTVCTWSGCRIYRSDFFMSVSWPAVMAERRASSAV